MSDVSEQSNTLPSLFGIDGKLAVIADHGTGSSPEIAHALAGAGARIVLLNAEEETLDKLTAELRDDGQSVASVALSSYDESTVRDAFSTIVETRGPIDIFVCCNAEFLNKPFADISLSELDAQLTANLRIPFLLIRNAVLQMRQSGGGGKIVSVNTIGSVHPVLAGNAAYSSSRAAMRMMVKCAALDHLADGILINSVLPGNIPNKVRMAPQTQAKIDQGDSLHGPIFGPGRLPLGLGDPWDIAAAVLFLVGPSGKYMTGQEIILDGGFAIT